MPTETLLLAVDLGTQQFKAMVVSAATGEVVSRAVAAVDNYSEAPGMVEQDPQQWQELLFAVGRRAVDESGKAAAIAGIGVTGHMHTLVGLDAQHRPVHRAVVWNDTRSSRAAETLARSEPLWNPPISAYTLPKLLWLEQHHPEAASRVSTLVYPKDYLRLCLTGRAATDPSDASSSLAWDFRARAWDHGLLCEHGLGELDMPEVLRSNALAGELDAEPARRLGLRAGLPVATGAGDVAAALIGANVVDSDAVLINAGTAAQVITLPRAGRDEILDGRHERGRIGYLFEVGLEDRLFIMGALPSAGHSLAWWRRLGGGRHGFEDLDAMAAEHPLEPSAAIFLPYLQGTGTPSMVDGGLAGFVQVSASEDVGRLTRAVIEGVAMGIRGALDAMMQGRPRPSTIVITGGLGRSSTFCRALSTLLAETVEVRQVADVSCIGAAATAWSLLEGEVEAIPIRSDAFSTYTPDSAGRDAIEARYLRFQRWTDIVVEAFGELR